MAAQTEYYQLKIRANVGSTLNEYVTVCRFSTLQFHQQSEGGEAVANQEENRLQLLFDEKPSEEQRSKLKSWGFRWSPSNKAWQRQLNSNAIYAAGQIEFIKPLDGRTPRELQPKPKSKDEQER